MLRRAALLAIFTFTPLGAYVAEVELAAVRTAREKARERKRKKAERKKAERATGADAQGGARRAALAGASLQQKRRRRRGKRKKKQPAEARGPWLAFGLSVLATAAAGLFVWVRRRESRAPGLTGGNVEGTRMPKLTDPYDRQDGT